MQPDSSYSRPRLLDLFCGAGGAGVGYWHAGFDVVGVDLKPQPRYPFPFVQADALEVLENVAATLGGLGPFDAIHASPPCQAYSAGGNMWKGRLPDDRHPDLIAPVRDRLNELSLPYVIENVERAPLRNAVTLCGSAFGLGVKRHRIFECSFPMLVPPCDDHRTFKTSVFGGGPLSRTPAGGGARDANERHAVMQRRVHVAHQEAQHDMGIWWMTRDEMSEAIPPAYTEYIGRYLVEHLNLPALSASAAG